MYDETIYEEAQKYLHSVLLRWREHLPDLCEDAFQEGMIQVWRDVEADVQPKLKLLRRAALSAEKFMHRNGEYFFGKPKKSRDGISRSNTTREKIQVFLEEYLPVHNGVYPTARMISDATGIKMPNVHKHLKNIREGRIDHMKYDESGRRDWNYYSTMSVELLNNEGNDGHEGNRAWTDNPQLLRLQDSFESSSVGTLDLVRLLNQLGDSYRETLYLYLFQGFSATEIAKHRGLSYHSNSKGTRILDSALNQASMLIDPYRGSCTKGHERTPETCKVKRRDKDGVYIRICLICRVDSALATTENGRQGKHKVGRKEELKCPKGHDKVRQGKAQRLVCNKCKVERNRERRNSDPEFAEAQRKRQREYYRANQEKIRAQKNRWDRENRPERYKDDSPS